MNELMKRWKAQNTTEVITQIPDMQTFIFQKFFAQKTKGHKVNKIEVPIKKGSSIILKSITPDADNLIHDRGNVFLLDINLPRFALQNPLLASELNDLKAYEGKDQEVALAKMIGGIMTEHKASFLTTLEYMAAGALFGKVIDGSGKVLFELESTRAPVEFKTALDPIKALRDIDDMLAAEFGIDKSYTGLASREFMDGLWTQCVAMEMDKKNQAKWIEMEGKRCLEVHGTMIYPYSAKFKNAKDVEQRFIPANEAVFIPNGSDAFETHFGTADHIEAVGKTPTMYFATSEPLPMGKGFSVLSETKPIPVCVRPQAVIKAKWVA